MKQKKVIILILTKDEEATISSTILGVKKWLKESQIECSQIAIVDDSSDKTIERAHKEGVSIVRGAGLGLGHSYAMGLLWALSQGAEFIITIDGDGQVDLEELPRFWRVAEKENADLVLASRFLIGDRVGYDYPRMNRWGVFLLAKYMSIMTGEKITDSHGGIRLYSRRAAEVIHLRGRHTYVQESILTIARHGFKIIELESHWKPRLFGQSRVVHSRFKYFLKMAIPLALTGLETRLFRRVKL